MLKYTKQSDLELYDIVCKEYSRASRNIEMIASESTAPFEIMELSGSIFVNKTLEGYPGKRFQSGSEVADELELLMNKRAKELYGAEHVNAQVYSGTTANYAVYASVLEPGDSVLSMRLDQGGHLTHGSKANFLSKVYQFEHYGVSRDTELIDYNELEEKAAKFKPKMIVAGASSYPRLIDYEKISGIAKSVGAMFMVDMAHISGLVAAKVIPSPVPYADFVTSSTSKTISGPRAGFILCKEEYGKALDHGVFPGSLGSLHLNTMAAKAWMFQYAKSEEFKSIMEKVLINAKFLAGELEKQGFRVVSCTTENHIVLLDIRSKGISGKVLQHKLDSIGITVNKNQIPFDPAGPAVTSGIRIGTTCVSQRGFGTDAMSEIAQIMSDVADNPDDEKILQRSRERVLKLTKDYPLYNDHGFFE